MSKFQEYTDRAAECERLGEVARGADVREVMRHLAMRWRAVADEERPKTTQPPARNGPNA